MEKSFFFLDGVQADKTSKRLMRRHVMKGKNAGKTFLRSSKQDSRKARLQPHGAKVISSSATAKHFKQGWNNSNENCVHASNHSRDFGNFISILPAKTDAYSLQIIDKCDNNTLHQPFHSSADAESLVFILTTERMYSAQLGISQHEGKSMWLNELFSDEATFHCSIAMMQACNEIFLDNGKSSPKALFHLSRAFGHVRDRLQSDQALSNSTIMLVVSLIHQEQIRQYHSAAKIHVEGLRKIIKLRGGLSQLESSPLLVLKVCKTDIMFALQDGQPPMFFRDRMAEVRKILESKGLGLKYSPATFLEHYNKLDKTLREIFADVMSVCLLFNNGLRTRTLDIPNFLEILVSICYRLLRFRPIVGSRKEYDVESAYHIGLIIFMMTIFLQFDHRRLIEYGRISSYLNQVLDSKLLENENELLLWLSIVGGIWISGDVDSEWIAPRIQLVTRRLSLETWDEVRCCVSKFPWIDVIHIKPGYKLWNQVQDKYRLS